MQDKLTAQAGESIKQRPIRQRLQDRFREQEEPRDQAAQQATGSRQQGQSRPGPSSEQGRPPRPNPEQQSPTQRQGSAQARLVEQCESHVTLLMTHLLKVGPFYFIIPPPPDGLRWSRLIQRLEGCIESCEQCAQQAIREKRAEQVARQSVSLQEAARILTILRPLAARLPPGLLVQNPERLQLHPGPRIPPAQVRELLDAADQPPANPEVERAYPGIPDEPTGIRGYTALVKEFEELSLISPPPGGIVTTPESKQAWQSTLDALETKLMDYAAGLERQQPMSHEVYKEKLRTVIRLRGWIVAARRQHAETIKRGYYYRPQC